MKHAAILNVQINNLDINNKKEFKLQITILNIKNNKIELPNFNKKFKCISSLCN